jgi:dihydroxyacetone kinase-like predicted kinase
MVSLTTKQTQEMFLYAASQMAEKRPLLTQLDRDMGDGTYGMELAIGFGAVWDNLSKQEPLYINDIFKNSGAAMLAVARGAGGVIFGNLLLGGVIGMPILKVINLRQLATIFTTSLQTVKERDGANIGGTTIIDTFELAVVAFVHSVHEGDTLLQALYVAEFGAQEGMDAFQDSGATSVWLFFKAMREWVTSLESRTI